MNKMRGFNQIMCSLALFVCRQEFFYVFGFKFFIVNKLESFHFGYNRNERGWKREWGREERKVGLIVFGPLAKSFAASSETILICSYSFVYLLKSLSLTLFLFPALIHALFFLKCCFHHALVDYFSSPFSVCVCLGGWVDVRSIWLCRLKFMEQNRRKMLQNRNKRPNSIRQQWRRQQQQQPLCAHPPAHRPPNLHTNNNQCSAIEFFFVSHNFVGFHCIISSGSCLQPVRSSQALA